MRAKYCSVKGFWRVTNTKGVSSVWRQVLKLREVLKPDVQWHVETGSIIDAVGQPWFPLWMHVTGSVRGINRLKVADLFDFGSETWRMNVLLQLFGAQATLSIVQTVHKPKQDAVGLDALIWRKSKSGAYNSRDGYSILCVLRNPNFQSTVDIDWQEIWSMKGVIPRVKMFIWRALMGALPIANGLHKRIPSISPVCQRCSQENEYENHMFFFCPASRAVWFMSTLMIRVDELPLSFVQAFTYIFNAIDSSQRPRFCNTLWQIWKARNKEVIEGVQFQPDQVCAQVQTMEKEWFDSQQVLPPPISNKGRYDVHVEDYICLCDASWDVRKRVGLGTVWYDGTGRLLQIKYKEEEAEDPFTAELLAIKMTIMFAELLHIRLQFQKVHIFSDCTNLVTPLKLQICHLGEHSR